MKKTALLFPVALLLTSFPCAAQGPLTPSGAPGETMKTLGQVEPRTPISSLPYAITEPGSYYVISNLHSTGHGIVIQSSGVTVDLMGFSITGDGMGGDFGIHVDGATNAVIDKVVIKGGTVSGFYGGLYCQYMNNSRIERCLVSSNTSIGVYFYGQYGQCNGNTMTDCTVSGNVGEGVRLSGFGGQCNGNTIADCSISANGDTGLYLVGLNGQCGGNRIEGNQISRNTNAGIHLFNAEGNRIEGNNVSGTSGAIMAYGIRTYATRVNLILKNTCVGNGTNYDLVPTDTYGPIVTNSGSLPTSGAAAHPWANFSM